MNELSFFTGTGGGILGSLLLGWRTVGAIEKDHYCRESLLRRQRDGLLPLFPIWDDIRTFRGRNWRGRVDIVTAGFPCQPFSSAGKRLGEKDERNLWPETIRVIREVDAEWAFLENVPGLVTSGYFGTILRDLAQAGLDAEWGVFSAAEVGAPQKRERLWIVAHSRCIEWRSETQGRNEQNRYDTRRQEKDRGIGKCCEELANPARFGRGKRGAESKRIGWNSCIEHGSSDLGHSDCPGQSEPEGFTTETETHGRGQFGSSNGWPSGPGEPQKEWEPPRIVRLKSRLGGSAHGVAHRVDRLKAIGNGQVPQTMVKAWMELSVRF